MTLALVIEASLESYYQFWTQINFNLPDILIILYEGNLEDLMKKRILSIVLSFITIIVSIIKIRFYVLKM